MAYAAPHFDFALRGDAVVSALGTELRAGRISWKNRVMDFGFRQVWQPAFDESKLVKRRARVLEPEPTIPVIVQRYDAAASAPGGLHDGSARLLGPAFRDADRPEHKTLALLE